MQPETIEIQISGKSIPAKAGETIVHALWAAGMADAVQTGCAGGVCGACTVTVRFADGRPGGTDLACLRSVEEGMQVFPCPVESRPPVAPIAQPELETLQSAFPTLDRCTKCGSCTTACPMTIPVMDSVLRMQRGEFQAVAEDFTTCIHCGLCRLVCEDKVLPHNMGMWVRRSLGMSLDFPVPEPSPPEQMQREWEYLLSGDAREMLERAKGFRRLGRIDS